MSKQQPSEAEAIEPFVTPQIVAAELGISVTHVGRVSDQLGFTWSYLTKRQRLMTRGDADRMAIAYDQQRKGGDRGNS